MAATPPSSSIVNQVPSSSSGPSPTSSSAAVGQILSSSTTPVPSSSPAAANQTPSPVVIPVPISSGVIQVLGAGGDTVDEFTPVTLESSAPAPTGTAKYPTAEGGNIAMAAGFNNVYATLNVSSPCNPSDPSQAYACVSGEIAECQSDETYVLKSCPRFESCYALPKPSGLTGVVVQCAVPSDAARIRAGLSSSTAAPVTVTSQPAQLLQAEGDFSHATQSVSAQKPAQPVTSSPSAEATIQSQRITPTPSVLTVTPTASQNQGSDQVDKSTISTDTSSISAQSAFRGHSQVLNPSVLPVTTTGQQVHDYNLLNNPLESETSSPAPSTTAAVVSVPMALFAVVTAPNTGRASPSESSAQASLPNSQASQPYPEISTPITQSSTTSPLVNPEGLQPTELSVTSTSISSADGASTTFAPMGVPMNEKAAVGNGQATVTVTVTVTTTEKPAPVIITAS